MINFKFQNVVIVSVLAYLGVSVLVGVAVFIIDPTFKNEIPVVAVVDNSTVVISRQHAFSLAMMGNSITYEVVHILFVAIPTYKVSIVRSAICDLFSTLPSFVCIENNTSVENSVKQIYNLLRMTPLALLHDMYVLPYFDFVKNNSFESFKPSVEQLYNSGWIEMYSTLNDELQGRINTKK